MENNVVQLIQKVLVRIDIATQQSQLSSSKVTLIAVSKTKPIKAIVAAYQAGVRHFGENRASELMEKAVALQHLTEIKWHFIGHLQSRQSHPIAEYADYFHALDRIKIAQRLATQLSTLKRTLPVFIEVNLSGEKTKGGFDCAQWEHNSLQYQALLTDLQTIVGLPNLQIKGLMTMAPWQATELTVRDIFNRLRQLSSQLNNDLPNLKATELSMGMSDDFELAIEAGASYIRVGRAIFGARNRTC
jgi:pyridoxal phosphate enzyme (YggS family)